MNKEYWINFAKYSIPGILGWELGKWLINHVSLVIK